MAHATPFSRTRRGTAEPTPAADATSSSSTWHAYYTRARRERKLHRYLQERGYESYVPVAPRTRQWHDRKKLVEWPLFPSYVFARTGSESVREILATPGICEVVRFGSRAASITDAEIENIRRFAAALATTGCTPPPVAFENGQPVRVTAGPFRGVEGIVLEVRGSRRVLVGLRSLGAGFEIDVPVRSLSAIRRSKSPSAVRHSEYSRF